MIKKHLCYTLVVNRSILLSNESPLLQIHQKQQQQLVNKYANREKLLAVELSIVITIARDLSHKLCLVERTLRS